jgi:hypothetical protein
VNVFSRFRPKLTAGENSPSGTHTKTSGNSNKNGAANSAGSTDKTDDKERSTSVPDDDNNDNETDNAVTLPLHQRLQLVRLSRGLKSNRQALKVLAEEGSWFGAKWLSEKKKQAVALGATAEQVAEMRVCKPETLVASVQTVDPMTGKVVVVARDVGLREFSFDAAFPERTRQSRVYDSSARKLVTDFLNGYNASVIVYGQTGSGKTYTMFGPPEVSSRVRKGSNLTAISGTARARKDNDPSDQYADFRGIVPRACDEVFIYILFSFVFWSLYFDPCCGLIR